MKKPVTIILTLFIAFVFLQSLPFKFSHSLETQHIFGTLAEWSGLHWFGQYGGFMIGTFELIASLMLLIPMVSAWLGKPVIQPLHPLGALLSMGIMTGAIVFHLFTPLGIVMPYFDATTGLQTGNDGGLLFGMACGTWVCALVIVLMDLKSHESQLKQLI